MITLKEILELDIMQNARLISGKKGIYHPVLRINGMEIPNIEKWISEGELLITTGYSMKSSPDLLENLIYSLYRKKCAGLMLKLKYIKEISAKMIHLSDQLEIPIIILDPEMNFSTLILAITEQINIEDSKYLKLAEKYTQLFTDNEVSNNGYQGISNILFFILQTPNVIIKKHKFYNKIDVVAEYGHIKFSSILNLFQNEKPEYSISSNYFIVFVPLAEDFDFYVISENNNFSDRLLEILESKVTHSIRIEFNKEKLLNDQKQWIDNKLMIDLLTGNISSENEFYYRLEQLSWHPLPYWLICFDIKNFHLHIQNLKESEIINLKHKIYFDLINTLNLFVSETKSFIHSDSFLFFLFQKLNESHLQQIQQTMEKINTKYHLKIRCVLSSSIDTVTKIKDEFEMIQFILSYDNAQTPILFTQNYLMEYFLYCQRFSPYLNSYIQDLLRPLENYQKQQKIDLTETICIYVKQAANISRAASSLYIHRNTLHYRLDRLKEIYQIENEENFFPKMIQIAQAIELRKIISPPSK